MNGEGISLVGPNFPFGYVGGMTPGAIPFGDTDGGLAENPTQLLWDNTLNFFLFNEWRSIINDFRIRDGGQLYIQQAGSVLIEIQPTGSIVFLRSLRSPIIATAITPFTVNADHHCILVTTGAGAFTVNLPTAVGIIGREYIIKKVDAGVGQVTIDAAGAETIDGALTRVLAAQWNSVTIVSDGANWVIVATT